MQNSVGVDIVLKLGGGVLAEIGHFDAMLGAIGALGRTHRLLIVPGGGPFADAVRDVDRQHGLSDDAAHWMAVLGMDQYAQVIASRLPGAVLVTGVDEIIAAARASGQVPVLAPSRWLREADPLPHSWDVTSDSIAAWVAGAIGARRLVLIKPPGVSSDRLVDPNARPLVDSYFSRALPSNVDVLLVAADRICELRDLIESMMRP